MYTGDLAVMTYNVFFKAVYGQDEMGHCGNLGVCLQNMAEIIAIKGRNYFNKAVRPNYDYDFIGLQEINTGGLMKLIEYINQYNNNFSNLYNYQIHETQYNNGRKIIKNSAVTFYRKDKFRLIKSFGGGLSNTSARPFLVTIYPGIIHINVHMPHDNHDHNTLFQQIISTINGEGYMTPLTNYRVIMAGDFNITNPLTRPNFTKIADFQPEPISFNTCCGIRPNKHIDHIFSNMVRASNYERMSERKMQEYGYISGGKPYVSDHLPVFAYFPSISGVRAASPQAAPPRAAQHEVDNQANLLSLINNKEYPLDQQFRKELHTIITKSNKLCRDCLVEKIIWNKGPTSGIIQLITILENSNAITEDKAKQYIDDIIDKTEKLYEKKYLKYKEKYLALKHNI
jgi:hypothetical protein